MELLRYRPKDQCSLGVSAFDQPISATETPCRKLVCFHTIEQCQKARSQPSCFFLRSSSIPSEPSLVLPITRRSSCDTYGMYLPPASSIFSITSWGNCGFGIGSASMPIEPNPRPVCITTVSLCLAALTLPEISPRPSTYNTNDLHSVDPTNVSFQPLPFRNPACSWILQRNEAFKNLRCTFLYRVRVIRQIEERFTVWASFANEALEPR